MPVLLDTNVLLLWLVGQVNPLGIERHGALKKYRYSDYELLLALSRAHGALHTLPNILTETINILGAGSNYARFAPEIFVSWTETYIASAEAMKQPEYHFLGLTDTAILLALGQTDLLVTADIKLHIAAGNRGLNTLNFDHYRLN